MYCLGKGGLKDFGCFTMKFAGSRFINVVIIKDQRKYLNNCAPAPLPLTQQESTE